MVGIKVNKKEIKIKIVFSGKSNVGKTSIIQSFQNKNQKPETTLGISHIFLKIQREKEVHLHVWDTAGQEIFDSMTKQHFRDSFCVIIVMCYGTEFKASFNNARNKINELQTSEVDKPEHIILVTNKYDLLDKNTDQEKQVQKYLQIENNKNLKHFNTSAINGENIQTLFDYLTQLACDHIPNHEEIEDDKVNIEDNNGGNKQSPKKNCCEN
eukprot:TRINITY_DN15077_c0_g1_i1.p1 TRINITY_DN15077_c0_g1~~TRINITY_DN15077_c0_g1_i1.p1  ORF type:complete len:212 (+),score=52.40 TRINITY_DN15077_c0_g1_i1:32-667(+)